MCSGQNSTLKYSMHLCMFSEQTAKPMFQQVWSHMGHWWQRFLFSHRQEQLSHASETFVRKEEVAFLIGENWFLSSILPVRRIEIRTSRNPRIFFLYKMQFTRTSYNFSSSDIMWLQLYLIFFPFKYNLILLKRIIPAVLLPSKN